MSENERDGGKMRRGGGIVGVAVMAALLLGLLIRPDARAQDAASEKEIVLIHKGKHWIWMARKDQFERMKKDLEPYFGYADKAFEALEKLWDMKMPRQTYGLLVNPQPGGGFATGD